MTRRASAWWWTALTDLLAMGYLLIAVISPLALIWWSALTGAVLIVTGLWFAPRNRPTALIAVVVGALVPVITGWWSLVVPLTAALIIVCGAVAVSGAKDRGPRRSPGHDAAGAIPGMSERALP
ncbi:MAG: hypothetical protein JWQ92_776 [Amnibacterium sp.]|nr:hypothetical protein [Amnibacterium sp.]